MGLCKCQRRKVTNLFCFEHDVNVCEHCLVSDHERCIVQSYVQWLQDSDYNPICIICKNLLKDEPTIRLICYDVFHWSCIDKYASELPPDTAPAGYQCPKCKECIFPPANFVSPVADILRSKLETVSWARAGLGQSLLQISGEEADKTENKETPPPSENVNILASSIVDDESNGYVIVNQKDKTNKNEQANVTSSEVANSSKGLGKFSNSPDSPKQIKQNTKKAENKQLLKNDQNKHFEGYDLDAITPVSHNRISGVVQSSQEQAYDSSLGIVLNIDNLDRDTGENKYKRRPILEWLSRFLVSRQLSSKRPMFRMTRQKKIMFIILMIFITLFTFIILFSRLGSISTEDDPALDPLNNPNIRVQ